jgi:hypothetical protein
MGIRNRIVNRTDVGQLAEGVDSTRRHLEQVAGQLAEVARRIAGPERLPGRLSASTAEERLDLANACISLELALQDAQKWARKVAEGAGGWRAGDGGGSAATGRPEDVTRGW